MLDAGRTIALLLFDNLQCRIVNQAVEKVAVGGSVRLLSKRISFEELSLFLLGEKQQRLICENLS